VETAKGKTREEIINRLADRIDSFERYSQPHSKLMVELAMCLAQRLGLAEPDTNAIAEAALLHDIGLYAMSPTYCQSPSALSFQERLDLWRHPVIGEQQMAKRDASRHAQLLVRWHHEWWNGSGYPDTLAFEDIPIGARILRAVELYSAITSDRPYRAALAEDAALDALKTSAGIECDPHVIKALVDLLEELRGADNRAVYKEPVPDAEQSVASKPHSHDSLSASEAEPATSSTHPDARQISSQQPRESSDHPKSSQEWTTLGEEAPSLLVTPSEHEPIESAPVEARVTENATTPIVQPEVMRRALPSIELLLSRARSKDGLESDCRRYGWRCSRYNSKLLLGFEASVLSQIEFRSIAMPFSGWAKLAIYLKMWGKLILANDQRAWAAAATHAIVQAREPLAEEHITRALHDVYVPGPRLRNAGLRRWFSETDAWWMDNLRRNIESLEDESMRAQALSIGMQTGDYALSFDDETRDLRLPLTTVFWRLAGRAVSSPVTNPHNQSFNLPVEEFIRHARTDLLYLSLPPAQSEPAGAEARSEWREAWVRGTADYAGSDGRADVQSRQSYLAQIDRLLRLGSQVKTWAVGCQETGLASAQDLVELIKEYRPVRATYSKDLTEVAGGLRSCIVVAERPAKVR
jgi:hypothetical protein